MKREDLKALGLTDEQVNAVMQQHGVDVENAKKNAGADATAAEKLRADGLQAQLDALTADLTQARASAATARELRDALLKALLEYSPHPFFLFPAVPYNSKKQALF